MVQEAIMESEGTGSSLQENITNIELYPRQDLRSLAWTQDASPYLIKLAKTHQRVMASVIRARTWPACRADDTVERTTIVVTDKPQFSLPDIPSGSY